MFQTMFAHKKGMQQARALSRVTKATIDDKVVTLQAQGLSQFSTGHIKDMYS